MNFSDYIKSVMREDRSELGVLINDKIRVKEYCEQKLLASVVDELFSHRIYDGYSPKGALASIKPPCVIRLNNGWHKMKFIFDNEDIKKVDLNLLHEWQATKWTSCEWSYRQIVPGFTVEKLLPKIHDLYKLFIFHGEVKFVWCQKYDISTGRIGQLGCTMYDPKGWKKREDAQWNKVKMLDFEKPERLETMIKIAESLYDAQYKFMRVDLYCNNNELRFSEMMQYHAGGTNGFGEFDKLLGSYL